LNRNSRAKGRVKCGTTSFPSFLLQVPPRTPLMLIILQD
jgi:hypothetical protein